MPEVNQTITTVQDGFDQSFQYHLFEVLISI